VTGGKEGKVEVPVGGGGRGGGGDVSPGVKGMPGEKGREGGLVQQGEGGGGRGGGGTGVLRRHRAGTRVQKRQKLSSKSDPGKDERRKGESREGGKGEGGCLTWQVGKGVRWGGEAVDARRDREEETGAETQRLGNLELHKHTLVQFLKAGET